MNPTITSPTYKKKVEFHHPRKRILRHDFKSSIAKQRRIRCRYNIDSNASTNERDIGCYLLIQKDTVGYSHILHLITLLPKIPRCMICVSALFASEFLADATRPSIRILIQRLFPLEQSKNFTVSVGELKLPLENLNIPLGYLACTARKRTFYYKRFLRD